MTLKEENIVNIAMRAGELLMAGKMERDDITGHAGLTDTIIALANEFEKKNAGVNFDAEGRDYWEEIDTFAEEQLLERYGIQQEPKDLEIKVIIDEGIVHAVLKNDSVPVNVEIIDIDPDYEDYEGLDDYRKQLYKDKSYSNCDYTVARFDEEGLIGPELDFLDEDPVKVFAVSAGGVRREFYSGDLDECKMFCKNHNWTFIDENYFEWDLEIEDSRDYLLPEGYYQAIAYYSELAAEDIESEFTRKHADKLVCCHENDLDPSILDSWVNCEKALGESLSLSEYTAIEKEYDVAALTDPAYSPFLDEIKGKLAESREAQTVPQPKNALKDIISKADEKRNNQQGSAPGKDTDLSR